MARVIINRPIEEYVEDNGNISTTETIYDDGSTKLTMHVEAIGGINYLSISEIYIPGSSRQKGLGLMRLIRSIVVRCAQDGLRLRMVKVYNENLIRRMKRWGISEVTPAGYKQRVFQTERVPQLADAQLLLGG